MKKTLLKLKTKKNCKYCKKEFRVFSSFDKFCSLTCKIKYQENKSSIEKNNSRRKKRINKNQEYEDIKNKVINRDKNICLLTGSKYLIEVHHIIPRSISSKDKRHQFNNLICVNKIIHSLLHADLEVSISALQYLLNRIYGYNYYNEKVRYSLNEDKIKRIIKWKNYNTYPRFLADNMNIRILYFLSRDDRFEKLDILDEFRSNDFVIKYKELLKDYVKISN